MRQRSLMRRLTLGVTMRPVPAKERTHKMNGRRGGSFLRVGQMQRKSIRTISLTDDVPVLTISLFISSNENLSLEARAALRVRRFCWLSRIRSIQLASTPNSRNASRSSSCNDLMKLAITLKSEVSTRKTPCSSDAMSDCRM